MLLKWLFIGDTWEDSDLHIHCSGLLGDRVPQVHTIVLLRGGLERLFIDNTGKDSSACSVFRLPMSRYDSGTWMIVLKRPVVGDSVCSWWQWGRLCFTHSLSRCNRALCVDKVVLLKRKSPFISDTGEDSACSLLRSSGSWCDSFTWKMVLEMLFISDTGEDFCTHS